MCGIIGFTGRKQATEILLRGLEALEYRGYDSAGISVMTKDGPVTVKRPRTRCRALLGRRRARRDRRHLRYRSHPLGYPWQAE